MRPPGVHAPRELGVESEIRTYPRRAFDRRTRYQLHTAVGPRARETLREAGVLSARGAPLERPPKHVVGRSLLPGRVSARRGARRRLTLGSEGPHLELRASGIDGARLLSEIAAREGVTLATLERRAHAIAYAKGGEEIADLLAVAGRARRRFGSTSTRSSPAPAQTQTGSRMPTKRT